jgi:hypothetical protein
MNDDTLLPAGLYEQLLTDALQARVPTLFHWESQSATSVTSTTGQRYIQHVSIGFQGIQKPLHSQNLMSGRRQSPEHRSSSMLCRCRRLN